MTRTIKMGTQAAGIEITDLSRPLQDAIERNTRGALGILRERIQSVRSAADARWPVKTGRSKRDLRHAVVLSGDDIRAMVGNRNSGGYVYYLSAYHQLLRRPMEDGAPSLARELAEASGRFLGGAQ